MEVTHDVAPGAVVGYVVTADVFNSITKILGELPASRVLRVLIDLEKTTKPVYSPKVAPHKNDTNITPSTNNSSDGTSV